METLTLSHFNIIYNTTNLDKIFVAVQEECACNPLPWGEGGTTKVGFKVISIKEEELPLYETLDWSSYPANIPLVALKS